MTDSTGDSTGWKEFVASQATNTATTFSPGSAAPYVTGITQNVLGGTVNTGVHTSSVDTELLSHPGGTSGRSLAGTETVPVTASVQQAAMSLYGLRPDEIRALQGRLVAAGYMTARDVQTPGVIDGATAKAYGDLLQDTSAYNAAGNQKTIDQQLSDRAASFVGTAVAAGGNAPRGTRLDVIQLQDPATLRAAAHAAFKDVTGVGRAQKDKLVEKFVTAFTAQQVAAQRTVNSAQDQLTGAQNARENSYAAGGNPGDGPISQEVQVAAPDMTSQAAEFARAQAPAAAGAHDITKQFGTFLHLLGGII